MYLLKVTLKAPKEKCVFNSEKKKKLLCVAWFGLGSFSWVFGIVFQSLMQRFFLTTNVE